MSREQNYTAIVLKKQPFGEADEIITFFTEEAGKVRALAKSVKLPKSLLQNSLQIPFLVSLRIHDSGKLPKIIGAQVVETFAPLRRDLKVLALAFYALETVLKFTPDWQANASLFKLCVEYLKYLSKEDKNLEFALAKFKVDFLAALGYGLPFNQAAAGRVYAETQLKQAFLLKSKAFGELPGLETKNTKDLQRFLSEFISYHLEGEVKSEKFINMI